MQRAKSLSSGEFNGKRIVVVADDYLQDGHPKSEPCLRRIRMHIDPSTMRFSDLAGNVEAEPKSFGISAHLAPVESLEQVLHHFLRNWLPGIGDHQFQFAVFLQPAGDPNGTIDGAVRDRVAEKV